MTKEQREIIKKEIDKRWAEIAVKCNLLDTISNEPEVVGFCSPLETHKRKICGVLGEIRALRWVLDEKNIL